MCTYLVGGDFELWTEPSSTTILCVMQEMKALGRLGTCADSSDLSLLANVIIRKRGSSVFRHLPLVLEIQGSIPAPGEENFCVRPHFL